MPDSVEKHIILHNEIQANPGQFIDEKDWVNGGIEILNIEYVEKDID